VGTRIGPELTGMAVHTKEHLLTDILDPSRSVEGNFRAYSVVMKSGRILTGLLASESKTAIELYDAEGKKQTLLREEIDELVATPKSLMPDGFEKQVSRKDLTDLLEFLTQHGKFLPLPLQKAATVVSTKGMFNGEEVMSERLVMNDWQPKTFAEVPFHFVDPDGGKQPNAILLYGPQGKVPQRMPKSVSLPVNAPAKAIHFLSGVSGWGFPYGDKGSVSMIVRLHYEDGATEDHALRNGVDFADYNQQVNVPGSQLAFTLGGKQLRYLAIKPGRRDKITQIDLVKGPDDSAPVVLAATVEISD
jgi:putative heme-binding domain-containing protein